MGQSYALLNDYSYTRENSKLAQALASSFLIILYIFISY